MTPSNSTVPTARTAETRRSVVAAWGCCPAATVVADAEHQSASTPADTARTRVTGERTRDRIGSAVGCDMAEDSIRARVVEGESPWCRRVTRRTSQEHRGGDVSGRHCIGIASAGARTKTRTSTHAVVRAGMISTRVLDASALNPRSTRCSIPGPPALRYPRGEQSSATGPTASGSCPSSPSPHPRAPAVAQNVAMTLIGPPPPPAILSGAAVIMNSQRFSLIARAARSSRS